MILSLPDECCSNDLGDALLSGSLDGKTVWVHDKCGCEWRAQPCSYDGQEHVIWMPADDVEVIPVRIT